MVGTYFSKEALHFRDINSDIYRLNDIKTWVRVFFFETAKGYSNETSVKAREA